MKFSPVYDRHGTPWYVRESKMRALAATFRRQGAVSVALVVPRGRSCAPWVEIQWAGPGPCRGRMRLVALDVLPDGGEAGEPVLTVLRAAIALLPADPYRWALAA